MARPRWDDPESFSEHLPSDYNPKGVYAEGPQPPTNPLTKFQSPRPVNAASGALPPKLARAVLTAEAKKAGRLRLAMFSHRRKPPQHPEVTTYRAPVDTANEGG